MKMSQKILYIDPISPPGHVQFNSIYITALSSLDLEVEYIFKDGYEEELPLNVNIKLSIPQNYFAFKGKLEARVRFYQILRYIKQHIDFSQYEYVIFSSFEEISFALSGIKRNNIFLICHDNARGLKSVIKRVFLKHVSQTSKLIVFEDYIKQIFDTHGITSVKTIPHSYIEQDINQVETSTREKDIKIFVPSSSTNVDYKLLEEICVSDSIKNMLKEKEIKLYIKNRSILNSSSNIQIIENRLTNNEYKNLLNSSDIILIPYSNFDYRVSGVFFESISHKKIIFIKDIESFNCYKGLSNSLYFFKNIEELSNLILTASEILNKPKDFERIKDLYGHITLATKLSELFNESNYA